MGIDEIHMIYGQSMGSEIGMELHKQLLEEKFNVYNLFFDGAPMLRLSGLYKAYMRFELCAIVATYNR